ncbi:MAG: hypothetical protein WBX16_06805 [Candidatus Acidiferrales bacterium]
MSTTQQRGWFEVDKEGLRQTLGRKSKSFALFELLQNAFDEDGCRRVDVTLAEPVNGISTLIVRDDSPTGYRDLSNAHTMFANSYKKTDPTKRGRYNLGDKLVLALCDEATITSTSGQTIFRKDGTRGTGRTKTEIGSEFRGVLPLTQEEFDLVTKEVGMVVAPIRTTFNGKRLPTLLPIRKFSATLPTEVADEKGIMRTRQRKTDVKLYDVPEGREAYLYEKGLPVCPIEAKWSVEICQKVPVNLERDFVSDAYKTAVYVAVINEMHDALSKEDMAAIWVQRALEDDRISTEAAARVFTEQFGTDAVLQDLKDKGSNSNAVAHGKQVIPRGVFNRKQLANLKKTGLLKTASEAGFETDHEHNLDTIVPAAQYSTDLKRFVKLIQDVTPYLLNHPVTVRAMDDEEESLLGCTQWGKKEFVFTVNIGIHNIHDWTENIELLIHELAHFREQSNAHCVIGFYEAVTTIGAKLAQLAIQKPRLFRGIETSFLPEKFVRVSQLAQAAKE